MEWISAVRGIISGQAYRTQLGPGKTVVMLAPDTGERYFSTPLL